MISISEILNNKIENKLHPFLCIYGDENEEDLILAVKHIFDSGAKGLCIESKHCQHFLKNDWWKTLDIILRECKKYNLEMWTIDEPFVPSGYANGAVKNHPSLRKKHLVETHVDVIGPMPEGKFLVFPTSNEDELLGVVAYKREKGNTEDLIGEAIDLSNNIHDNVVFFNVPSGLYRVFFIFATQHYANDYIDFFNKDSVQLIIDEIYESHYQHYKDEFGKTFKGFFSDEPGFWNPIFGYHRGEVDDFKNAVGVPGYAMPWGENVWDNMSLTLKNNKIGNLVGLWYNIKDKSSDIRFAYMNAVTTLYNEVFNKTIGDWCIKHNVFYNGHIVEDSGVHSRLGTGVGHYFRAMKSYDMAGVDIVLHQVLPGFAHYRNASFGDMGLANADFYHYVLGQLAASDAHLNKKSSKALCEIFGAFGWGEDITTMKWLIDFMLVRGVTNFIPHSFTTHTHDLIFPPTFSAKNNNPQFGGLKRLFNYVNEAGSLLENGDHVVSVALLYSGFASWIDSNSNNILDKTARTLYDRHICYDILSEDLLENIIVENGNIICNKVKFGALIIPGFKELPSSICEKIYKIQNNGGVVLYIDRLPKNCSKGEVVKNNKLAEYLKNNEIFDVEVVQNELLRFYHTVNGNRHIYMFFNESTTKNAKGNVVVKQRGKYLRINLLNNEVKQNDTRDGVISLNLRPYESVIYVFDNFEREILDLLPYEENEKTLFLENVKWDIYLAPYNHLNDFEFFKSSYELVDASSFKDKSLFSGAIKYVGKLFISESYGDCHLDLGEVGGAASLVVNGRHYNTLISNPYRFDLSNVLLKGENDIEITVFTSLAGAIINEHKYNDLGFVLTAQIPFNFSGLKGPISLKIKS